MTVTCQSDMESERMTKIKVYHCHAFTYARAAKSVRWRTVRRTTKRPRTSRWRNSYSSLTVIAMHMGAEPQNSC